MTLKLLDRIRSNDHLALSRTISKIENEETLSDEFFQEIHTHSNSALRIGVTGPPGAGKSTLVDQLIEEFLKRGKAIGIIAVDPTSPFTGGALLGDRVRMNRFIWNDNVFIRSMGSHGNVGGLARKTQDAGDVLAASGKDIVIYETVGVGQGEHDVAKAVDITLVVLVPESGDEIQLMKAGLIEIANIFVVNKSDREGSQRLSKTLVNLLHTFSKPDQIIPPVTNTVAIKGTGTTELVDTIFTYLDQIQLSGELEIKKLNRYRNRVASLIQEKMMNEFWTQPRQGILENATKELSKNQICPYTLAKQLIETSENE